MRKGIQQMILRFSTQWTSWEEMWTFKPKISSISGKIIWGRIMKRQNKIIINSGGVVIRYASKKEADLDQKHTFLWELKHGI